MPRHAEPREFVLSEYQRSRYRIFTGLCALAASLSLFRLTVELDDSWLAISVLVVSAFSGWFSWLKSGRPFARLSPHGLTIHDGILLPWSASWAKVYAIETPGDRRAELRLAGVRTRRVPLTMLEREDRQAFVSAVKTWIYTSH
ncbi:MAG: hypothetical protein HY925_00010 [Elusimicrobia bacterium]|nr:hypothetical protein [Elusimicrobiota bacterium]